MSTETIIGVAAGVLTSASSIPQLIKTIKEKDAENISVVMLLILTAGVSLWVYYGFLKDDLPLIITNAFSVLTNILLLICTIMYKKADNKNAGYK